MQLLHHRAPLFFQPRPVLHTHIHKRAIDGLFESPFCLRHHTSLTLIVVLVALGVLVATVVQITILLLVISLRIGAQFEV
jgi:hypothetical protein